MDHLLRLKNEKNKKVSLLLQVGSLIYDFCLEMKKYPSNENCQKAKIPLPYTIQ